MTKISGKEIARMVLDHLKQEVSIYKKEKQIPAPQLVVFSVNPDENTLSFLRSKQKAVEYIGGSFKLLRFGKNLRFEELANKLNEIVQNPHSNAVIIQQPLPASLTTMTIFNFVTQEKEIEGYKAKPFFENPLALAVLTILKVIFQPDALQNFDKLKINVEKDATFLKSIMRKKKLVLIGRGKTGGKPVADLFAKLHVPFVNINSKTIAPEQFFKEADIIISAVGKPVIKSEDVKPGVVLISIGLRSEEGHWSGDYIENEIKDKALAYTPTPGGVGPITVAFLVSNLVEAWKIQNDLA